MGTTSEKLTYLNTTKEKIKDSINLTGANIGTSDTFRSYASKLKKGYIDIINNGIDTLYSNFPKVSGIGSNLSLTPTYEAPMKLNEIQGSTLQDGTPTPNTPVEIQSVTGLQKVNVCGKNLLDAGQSYALPANENYSQVIGEIYLEANNKYYFSYNVDNDSASNTRSTMYLQIETGNRIYQDARSNKNLTAGRKVWEYTPTESATYNVGYWLHTSNVAVSISNFMISTSSDTTYEPYQSATYELNLGKNLFDKDNVNTINGYFTGSGTTTITGHNSHIIIYIPCNPNTTYTVQKLNEGSNKRFGLATSETIPTINGTIMQSTGQQNNQDSLTITTNSTANYLLVWCYVTNDEQVTWQQILDSIQIEKGTQATSYSPYFTPIELNHIPNTDYKDRIYKDNGKWYVEKQIGKVVLDGSESWSVGSYGTNSWKLSNVIFANFNSNEIQIITNKFKGIKHSDRNTEDSVIYTADNTTFWLRNTPYTTKALVQSGMSGEPIYYILASPTYTEITNTELIEDLETLYTAKSQEGTTNISITSEDLEMILNVSALKGEV